MNISEQTETILVTGGAGFIGANFVPYFISKYPNYIIICLDKLTYAGSIDNLAEVQDNSSFKLIVGDLCNRDLLVHLFNEYKIQHVIHFAAESHVDNSISGPDIFIKTNINGTFTLLDVAKNYWMEAPFRYKPEFVGSRFHHISTDEVYGSLGSTGLFTENTPYTPNSPYSASKAGSDLIVRSYHHTFGMNVVTTNCSNNYGPKQHNEKLIPTIIRKAMKFEPIPIYGDGSNIRDWLYVMDHCKAVDLVFHQGRSGQTYNIGGENERTNLYITNIICGLLDEVMPQNKMDGKISSYKDLITFVQDRPGHDLRYAIDVSKLKSELGWEAEETFETGIRKTIEWYLHKGYL